MVLIGYLLIGYLDVLVLVVVMIVLVEFGCDIIEVGVLYLDLGMDGFIIVRVIEVVFCGGV